MTSLALVNTKDEIVSFAPKEKIHKQGILHRAFSVYVFNNKGQLLIHQRSKLKSLWPLYWSNSCCSHPYKNEDYIKAGERRLKEELGFTCSLRIIDRFHYRSRYKNIGWEDELCTILVGEYDGKVKPNPKEVADWKWADIKWLQKEIKENPDKYTPWFKIGLKRVLKKREKEEKNYHSLKEVFEIVSKRVEPVIKEILKLHIDKKFHKLLNYQISTGGKRLRPTLAIISSRLLNGKLEDVLYPAAGLEILHNCTLIIDDIIDHSNMRRGEPTVWYKFGKSIAECVGIHYSASVFEGANRSEKPEEISEIFIKTMKTVIEGEILDILFEQSGREDEPYVKRNRFLQITNRDYFEMVKKKTASLFQASCEIGGICSSARKEQIDLLRNYGFNLGIAFQIQDDILDIFGQEKKFGKKIGKDIEERKLGNIIVNLALKELSNSDKKEFLKILRKKELNNKDIRFAISLINKTNAYQKALYIAKEFIQKAKENLKRLPQNKWNKLLNTLADFVIYRQS